MKEFLVSERWKETYPGAAVGVLAMENLVNSRQSAPLDAHKAALEAELRERFGEFDRSALREIPTFEAYHAYYKRFRKTYHVQLQLESIVHKNKSIPRVNALVEAMFIAELEDHLLTAGHDLDLVRPPVGIDIAQGDEIYTRINGQEQLLKAGDMMISDAESVLSSIIYGPDRRTAIHLGTNRVLYTAYAPAGIDEITVRQHLENIRDLVSLASPGAAVTMLAVKGAG
jgi:DNA/RNA-binding domain of Phe-tRNA-synthetase-like protein